VNNLKTNTTMVGLFAQASGMTAAILPIPSWKPLWKGLAKGSVKGFHLNICELSKKKNNE
jgi:hypothetical protein